MAQELKALNIKASINLDEPSSNLENWDAQASILKNTGIERDGGVTNLYRTTEANTGYEDVLYSSNGQSVRLRRDEINGRYEVFSGDTNVGQMPVWGVKSMSIISKPADDAMVCVNGNFLLLTTTTTLAYISEIDPVTFSAIRTRVFDLPAGTQKVLMARTKQPTFENVLSLVAFLPNDVVTTWFIFEGGVFVVPDVGGVSNPDYAFYDNGWIVCKTSQGTWGTSVYRSNGTLQELGGDILQPMKLTPNYNQALNTWSFDGVGIIPSGFSPGCYGMRFTPPPAPLSDWGVTLLTEANVDPVNRMVVATSVWGGIVTHFLSTAPADDDTFYYNSNGYKSRFRWDDIDAKPEIYGRIDNGTDVAFKVHTIGGEPAYLSCSYDSEAIGCPITEIGGIGSLLLPHILKCSDGDYRVLYQRENGDFAFSVVSKSVGFERMQEIAPGIVKVNTASALCLVDTNAKILRMGGNAFNGFLMGIVGTNTTRYLSQYAGSVDTGAMRDADAPGSSRPVFPESKFFSQTSETLDVFSGTPTAMIYAFSIGANGAQKIKNNLVGTIYVENTDIPPPLGAIIDVRSIQLLTATAIRKPDFDGYELFNEVPGLNISFVLFGQLYFYDGEWIKQIALNQAGTLQASNRVVQALGLRFLAESPTAIYFYSDFDRALYSFDGGQSVIKQARMNGKPRVEFGVFSVRENTLALFTDSTVIWYRDGVFTETELPFPMPFQAYDTSAGVWVAKGPIAVKYCYFGTNGQVIIIPDELDGGTWGTAYADEVDGGTWGTSYANTIDGPVWGDTGGVVQPLVWRSRFLGFTDRMRQGIERYLFRVYVASRLATSIDLVYTYYSEAGVFTETRTIDLGTLANPYDSDGYAFFEFVPASKNSIASSIQLTCNNKIVLLNGYATVSTFGDSVAKNRG